MSTAMARRGILSFIFLTVAVGTGFAQGRGQRTMRFAAMDTNNDGVVTRREWRGSDESFDVHDWNRDGILSGDESRRAWGAVHRLDGAGLHLARSQPGWPRDA